MVASGGVLSKGCGPGGPGVCLGDGQTEAEGVPSKGGRGDALFRRMSPYLIYYVEWMRRQSELVRSTPLDILPLISTDYIFTQVFFTPLWGDFLS